MRGRGSPTFLTLIAVCNRRQFFSRHLIKTFSARHLFKVAVDVDVDVVIVMVQVARVGLKRVSHSHKRD